ncbi:MAG: gliding motility-associated C-terminal domain-containing protein [Chitinophagaceae bacterium]|nr:gliding motility-associated C-terminal domain-containing protein [Chitinophagaceae bacterium]
MKTNLAYRTLRNFISKVPLLVFSFTTLCFIKCFAVPPVNDSCTAATVIPVPNGGFGLGIFTSLQSDLTAATVQTGETFAPAIFVAGLDKKSVWFKFSIATIRAVRVTLTQPGTTITAGDAGFAVYQTSNCLPTNAAISSKLTPIVTFGNTYHPCVPSGEYLVQVSSNFNANGPITVQVEISDQTGAAYDHPNQAYAFGTVGYYAHKIDFNTECQSIEDATEVCSAFADPYQYNKSAWLTFKTPSYFDYIVLQLSSTNGSYFPSNNGQATLRTFGYTLYKGDAVTTPIGSLVAVSGCDSVQTNGYYASYRMYKCSDLDTGTTYSIQLFIKKDFADDVRWGILVGGQNPTQAPKPILSGVPSPTNALGNLVATPAGTLTTAYDVWGCNSHHNTSNCSPSLPDTGIMYNGGKYNLSSFFTFTLTGTATAIYFNSYVTQCGPQPLVRVFKQGLTNNCTGLDTANIIGVFNYNGTIDCLQPGDYTVQVSGQDYTYPYNYFTTYTPTSNSEQCLSSNLGTSFRLDMTAYSRKAANKYSLNVTGAFDSINRVGAAMQPLINLVPYTSVSDTMGCQNTLRPIDTTCNPVNNKIIYREFVVNDSGVVDFANLTFTNYSPWRYRLYSGDANALASAQNVFAFPDKVSGLKPITECMDWNTNCTNKRACVIPGTYTFTTMGGDADVGRADQPIFTFVRTRTKHYSPLTAQDMGSIWDTLGVNGGTIKTDVDDWACDDNAVAINGVQPCIVGGKPATKAIYRQFYLNKPSLVKIDNPYYYYCYGRAYGTRSLFYGKATDGLPGLSPVGGQWSSFTYSAGSTAGCELLPAGWYTLVSYNQGPSYDSTFRSLNLEGRYNSSVSYNDECQVTITPTCPGPVFNRPYKASVNVSNQPHLIQLVNRVNSTPAYPRTDTTYILPTEHFNCTLDTPFTSHPIKSCETAANRVVYYVFKTTQECFLQINAGGYFAMLYDKDVRTDSLQFGTLTPIQACNNAAGYIQYCFFQPGTYTLVIFAKDNNICSSVTPSVYIDKIGYSRFDYAKNAYDFAVVPPDSAWHYGKVGDVNPLNSGRAASNDIFYCTTGAFNSDPTDPVCGSISVNPNIYNSGPNKPMYDTAFAQGYVSRRNLWYTFVVAQPGYVTVKLESKTPGREYQQKFTVYKSNVDGTLPFSTVVNTGQVDSTTTQGLTAIATNLQTWYYCANLNNSVQFYRDPCSSIPTRYYILAENVYAEPYEAGGTLPNTQTEVSILIDSINLVLPKHDHYSQAGDIGTVGVGTFLGDVDNYSCATRDAADPFYFYSGYNCQKTLWYKFTPTITGNVRYRIYINGTRYQDYYQVQLYKQVIPGDSSINGLQIQGYHGAYSADNTYWAETCVSPGTYYLMITGCGQVNEYVYPEIQLVEAVGDFCSRAVPAAIIGPGSVTASVLIDCHTIGTDYGEFGPKLTCPQGANTADYKSSWFRMDIGGTDTLDVTAFLVENTNASSSDIKYRLMTGDCGAMQEQSCVLDALTQNTYQCLVPGQSYYVQIFTPILKFGQQVTGTIDLKLSAIAHADTCAPLTNCLATANFTSLFDCNTDESVKFVNFSTYGTSITYNWSFGYNGQTSSDVSPLFFYPPLPNDSTYTVKLVVENTSCGKRDSVTKTVTVPGRPYINFGNDIDRCDGSPVTLLATSFPGATYVWQSGSIADTFRVTATGNNQYWVKINYNGCSDADTVNVVISNITARPLQNIILCADSVSISASRGQGETYLWNTGATSASIYVSNPGVYWADVKYFTCTYRDSFVVNNVNTAKPLGNDTTVCISSNGYVLHATTTGAQSYSWQDGSIADTLKITAPGQYNVTINFGSCTVKDTVDIGGFPPAVIQLIDTALCTGSSLTLPWGNIVNTAGVYNDTLRYLGGCDSLIRKVTVNVHAKPNLGNDTTVCLAQNPFVLNGTVAGAISYQWQDGSSNAIFNVAAPGLYWVKVNFASCSTRDSIIISGSAAPVTNTTDTSICAGSLLTLPWGIAVSNAGTYRDTIPSQSGCDSIIRVVNLTVNATPSPGNDITVSICNGNIYNLTAAYNTSGLTAAWTINNVVVPDPSAIAIAGAYRLIATNSVGCADTAFVILTANPRPSLGNDTAVSICNGNKLNLTSLYSATGLTTNWTINSIAVANPSAVAAAGNYQLIVTNVSGCKDTAVVAVTVNPKPSIGKDTAISICQGSILNLTGVYATSGLAPVWTKNNSVVANPSAVSVAGVYQLVVTSPFGCSDTALLTLTINPKPSLGNDTTINICMGNSFNLIAVYNTGTNITNWTKAGVAVINPAAVNTAGIYQLISANAAGCADTVLLTLLVNINPVLVINDPVTTCLPLTADLTVAAVTSGSDAGLTYTYWNDAAATINYSSSTMATAGVYYIKGASAFGCYGIKPVTVTSYALPVVTAGNDAGICDKDSVVTLTATVTNITAPVNFAWEPLVTGGIASPTAAGTIVKPLTTPQQYIITVTDSYGCNYAVSDTVIVTKQPPVPAFAGNDTIAPVGLPHQLLANGGVSYIWSPDNVLNNRYIANPLATLYADSTLFSVIVTDNAGCKGYDSLWVKAYSGITYYVPNAFSPNGDGFNDIFRPLPVGIVSTEYFRVFNRYGELMFETSEYRKGWDGTYKGRPQPVANYVWILKGKGRNGKTIEMKGNVVLVR